MKDALTSKDGQEVAARDQLYSPSTVGTVPLEHLKVHKDTVAVLAASCALRD